MHFDVLSATTAGSSSSSRSAHLKRWGSVHLDSTSSKPSPVETTAVSPGVDPLDLTSPGRVIAPSPPGSATFGSTSSAEATELHSPKWHPPETIVEQIQDMMYEHSAVINTFIAGGLAGATSRTVVSPLERLKIIL